jgi:hypothetical protein
MANQITPVPVPPLKHGYIGEIRWVAEQLKKRGNTEAATLNAARKENAKFDEKLSDSEVQKIIKEVYGRKVFLSTGVMSKIACEVITWAVENVLLKGALNLFIGDPDIGKTLVAIFYIARLTKQGKKVVVICREDSYGHVWVPRLTGAGADLDLVIPVFGVQIEGEEDLMPWMLDNQEHLALLTDLLVKEQADLCLIDPLADFAGSKDLNKSQDVRTITGPLNKIAQETQVAMLANCHTTKAIQDSVIKTAAGSYQLMAAVAVAWYFMEDPDNAERRLMMQARNKYGTKLGWRYTIEGVDGVGVARITGSEYRSVNDMLKQKLDRDDSKIGEVRKWLDSLRLDEGPKPADMCNQLAKELGYEHDVISKACRQKKIVRDRKEWRLKEVKKDTEQQQTFDMEQKQCRTS